MPDCRLPYLRDFLDLYTGRADTERLSDRAWDRALRVAWSAGMVGSLAQRIAERGGTVPAKVERHFAAMRSTVRYRHQMARVELDRVAATLAPLAVPIIVAKGAAYVLQDLPGGRGRLFADVDIIVPRARIDEVERALKAAGWQSEAMEAYDQHYYRAWSHELPPMRFGGHPLELDVHHTILPLTGRIQPDAGALFDAAVRVEPRPFLVLSPPDQLLHACAHLFQDSDLSDRLRELADIDGLLRAYGADASFWPALAARTRLHGMTRPLFYALRYARAYFDTPIAPSAPRPASPNAALLQLMDRLVYTALPPCDPDGKATLKVRAARLLLYIRSLWLRMPPALLLFHLSKKGLRRVGPKAAPASPVAP